MEPVFMMKRQLSNETDFTRCIICLNLTANGFGAFRHAVEQRHDDVYDRLWTLMQDEETFLSMTPICHRTCRSEYTRKQLQNKVSKRRNQKKIFMEQPEI